MHVGVDLIEIERVARSIERYPRFRERVFTEAEREYCDSRRNPAQHYAARFAGKEAVGKALGCGVLFTWRESRSPVPRRLGPTACARGRSISP